MAITPSPARALTLPAEATTSPPCHMRRAVSQTAARTFAYWSLIAVGISSVQPHQNWLNRRIVMTRSLRGVTLAVALLSGTSLFAQLQPMASDGTTVADLCRQLREFRTARRASGVG